MFKKVITFLLSSLLYGASILTLVGSGAVLYEKFIYDYKGSSVVKLTRTTMGRSGGTGFLVQTDSGKRYTLTNAHICRINNRLVATKQNGDFQSVRVIKIYPKHDLCIMEPVEGIPALKIAKNLYLHERVWLIGHPSLRPLTLESGHFAGKMDIRLRTSCKAKNAIKTKRKLKPIVIRDAKGRKIVLRIYLRSCVKQMTSHYINNIAYRGNSGSPVVDKFGKVVGVLFAGNPSQPTSSFMVPLKEIHKFLKDK